MPDPKPFPFFDIFQETAEGALSPKRTIEVGGNRIGPGALLQKGVALGGVDFHLYKANSIAAEELDDGVLKIVGFYRNS